MNSKEQLAYWVIIPAAGTGQRMQADRPKQYLPLLGKTVLEHTIACFSQHPDIAGIVIVLSEGDRYWSTLTEIASWTKPVYTVVGGSERCFSVLNALIFLQQQLNSDAWVLVHDAARPCLQQKDLNNLIQKASCHVVGGILAKPVTDTLKRADKTLHIQETVDRHRLWQAMTPQMFRLNALHTALQSAIDKHYIVTDDASAMEFVQQYPLLIPGADDNIKITHPEDLALAKIYLTLHKPKQQKSMMRIGHGYDVHRFTEGNFITLGGVRIPYTQGLLAHSDGDVLIHALCDALLGAAALGDIGQHFPDTQLQYKNMNSRILLRRVYQLLQQQAYLINNIDITIVAQAPKMATHLIAMYAHLQQDLALLKEQINIKATTTEQLGFTGRKEGIAVYAVVLLSMMGNN